MDVEDIHEAVAVSMQFSNHQVRVINHKDQMPNHLQQVNSKDKNSTHPWDTISATVAKDGDTCPMTAHRLNKAITVVDVVVVETCVEEPQEVAEEEGTFNVVVEETRQLMPP